MTQKPQQSSVPQIQTDILKQYLKTRIINQFNRIPNPKCLYAHKQILQTINFIFDFKFQPSNINITQFYSFNDDPKAIDVDKSNKVIFFIYAKPQSMSTITSIILHNQSSFIKKQYFIYFVPVVDYKCQEELKRMGVWQKVKIKKFDFNFIPFTSSLLSLQLPPHLTSIQGQSCVIEALLKIQYIKGSFKNIIGKGKIAKQILQTLEIRRKQIKQITENEQDNDILIVLDRKTDLITPLMTGLSYECLLDFFYGINKNRIDVPGKLLGLNDKKIQTFLLHNKKDAVYQQISFMSIFKVRQYLQDKADKKKKIIEVQKQKTIDIQQFQKLKSTLLVDYELILNHKALAQDILKKLNQIQFNNSLTLQSSIIQGQQAQTPFKYEDVEYLSLFYPFEHLIRLICLHSQTTDQSRYYTKNQKSILQFLLNIERIDHLPSLYNLVKGQILRQSKLNNNWRQKSDKFNLFPSEGQQDSYTDINIIYSALSVKTIDLIIKNRFDPERSSLVSKQTYFRGSIPKYRSMNNVYVLFIGGVSYNQISCIKNLQKSIKKPIKILTTQILGNNQLIKKYLFNPLDE